MRPSVSIAKVERYWNARPCNIRHSPAPVGTLEWSRQVTKRKYFVEPHILEFAQFPRWYGKKVLEVGCGIGTDTIEFLKHGASVDVVELSRESLNLAVGRICAHRDSVCAPLLGSGNKVRYYNYNAEDKLPFGPYDLVYSFGVLHHTPDPFAVLWNAYYSLKPRGELRIMLYAKWSLKNLLGEQPEAQANCPLARTYSVKQAKELVGDAGFEVESITKTHIFPWRVKEYINYQYVKRWPYRVMPKKLFGKLERLLGHHLLITARRP